MSELSKIPPSESSKLSLKSSGNIILNELPTENVLGHVTALLQDIAKLYQIPNWTIDNSAHLASWIFRTYKYETLELVTKCLESPPTLFDDDGKPLRNWRLTPDTIASWLAVHMDRDIAKREREIHNAKFEGVNEWTDERLAELKKIAEAVEDFKIPSLTKEDIEKEGQEKPKEPYYRPPDKKYLDLVNKRIEYGQKYTDRDTGKRLPGSPTFEEWIK